VDIGLNINRKGSLKQVRDAKKSLKSAPKVTEVVEDISSEDEEGGDYSDDK